MSLSCSCSEWDGEGWGYNIPDNFTTYKKKRSCKCRSCGKKISFDDTVVKFTRFRGEDGMVPLAPWFMCEGCGGIYLNLQALGFCPDIEDYMGHLLEEYQEEYAHPAWESFKNYDFRRKLR